MNKSRSGVILTNNNIAYRPRLYLPDEKDMQTHSLESYYNKVVSDPDDYFARVKFTNFDLINHDCRGDDLEHDREYYEILFKKNQLRTDK